MTRVVSVVLLVVGIGGGCSGGSSGGGGGALTCAWLASDNCWKMTLDDAAGCLPPTAETGVLSADNKTCTYASGAVVTFKTALVIPIPDQSSWNFTITKGGQDCLHYEDVGQGFKVVVGGHNTVTGAPSGLQGFGISCPDGTTASTSNALNLLNCDADGGAPLGGLPGRILSSSGTSFSFSLLRSSSSGEQQLFDCSP
jgi:hypothetical protein